MFAFINGIRKNYGIAQVGAMFVRSDYLTGEILLADGGLNLT